MGELLLEIAIIADVLTVHVLCAHAGWREVASACRGRARGISGEQGFPTEIFEGWDQESTSREGRLLSRSVNSEESAKVHKEKVAFSGERLEREVIKCG